MQHPLLHSRRNLYTYLSVWLLISAIHAIALKQIYGFNIAIALADAGITDLLLALTGALCWYTVRFISIDAGHPLLVLFNHLIAALLFVSIWHLSAMSILRQLNSDPLYASWLQVSVPFRVVAGIGCYCIIALTYYLYKYYRSLKERMHKESDWNTLIKEGELALLKSQLQPHFIFNSLNSIHALMQSNPDRAQEMVLNLASFLRLSMDQDKQKLIPLAEELANTAFYSNIEKIRFGDRLHIDTQMDAAAAAVPVPHMILQPVMENAIRHGLFQNTEDVTIRIQASLTEKGLILSVSNNYDPGSIRQKGTGIGLDHVRRRLIVLYGRKDLVQISDENGIFNIEIRIPQ